MLLFLQIVLKVSYSIKIAGIHSESTPQTYLNTSLYLSNSSLFDFQYEILEISDINSEYDLKIYSLLIDFTGSAILSSKLNRISHDYQIPILCLKGCKEENSNYVINGIDSCERLFEELNKTLNLLDWSNYSVFYDDFQCSEELSLALNPVERFFVSYEMDELVNILISKFLKTSGVKQWILVTGDRTSKLIEYQLKENNMFKSGNGLLAGSINYFGLSELGILQLSNLGYEDSKSFEDFLTKYLYNVLQTIKDLTDSEAITIKLRQAVSKNHNPGLYNIQENKTTLIFDLNCEPCDPLIQIIYFQGSLEPPLSTITTIEMSMTAGITDTTNIFQISNQNMMNGVYIAADLYNSFNGTMKNFKFIYNNIPCYFSALYLNTSCYLNYTNSFGLFHMSAHSEPYSILLYSLMSKFNMNLFGSSDGIILADKNQYPLFISTGIPHKYELNALVHVIKFLGFDKFAVLCTNSSNDQLFVSYAIEDAYGNNMQIINDLNNYVFNVGLNGVINGSDSVFEDIVKSKARIVYIACSALVFNQVLNKFDDLGLKQGDIYFASIQINLLILANYSDPNYTKRKKFIQGTLSLSNGFFIGDLGNYVQTQAKTKYGIFNKRTCDYFDSFSLGYYAIKSLILQGKDYEKSSSIMTEARKARFIGCNGSIKVIDYTNLRESELYVISQISLNSSNFSNPVIANYYPSGSTIFKIIQPPYWNSYSTPSSIRTTNWNCPFDPDRLKTFENGRIVVGLVCGIVGVFTIANTIIIWKKFWNKELDDLSTSEEISFQDSVAMITVLMELIQTASMGPDLSDFFNVFQSMASAMTYSIDDFISVQNGIFWYILASMIILVGYWVLLCVVWIFQLHNKLAGFWLFRFFGWSITNLMPIIGNLMFIPIISTLINVFICDKSLDDTFDQSILDKDCYQTCWDSTHFPIAVISGVCILLYQPLAVYFRPLWQDLLPLLHIKALPRYLMMKSVFQIILIVLNKTLKRFDRKVHSIIFLLLISTYFLIIYLKNSYNYTRIRLWHRLGTVGLITLTLTCILNEYLYFNQALWVPVLILSWIILTVFGLRIQHLKYPSLLYRTAPKEIEKIFRWMFNLERSDSIFKSGKYEHKDQSKEPGSLDRMIFAS